MKARDATTAQAGIRAITFDGYGTLLSLDRPFDMLHRELHRAGLPVSSQASEAAFRSEMEHYRDHHLVASAPGPLATFRAQCADRLFEELARHGYPSDMQTGTRVEVLMASVRFRLYDDAVPAVTACRQAGFRVGIVSNWDCTLPEVLHSLGLDPAGFDACAVSALEGTAKPNASIFASAVSQLGVEPHEVLHVGDDAVDDFRGARAAGLRSVLLDREGSAATAGGAERIGSLDELWRADPPRIEGMPPPPCQAG